MSETPPNANGQIDGEQFDAEAAQKAKAMLDEGVHRGGDADVKQVPFVKDGTIVDSDGDSLRAVASRNYADFKSYVSDKGKQAKVHGEASRKVGELRDRVRDLDTLDRVAGLSPHQANELGSAEEQIDTLRQRAADASDKFGEASTQESANLWDAQQHLKQNRAGYEAAAIEDANGAGHDVTFGGQQYPAQQPPAPEQPNQNVA